MVLDLFVCTASFLFAFWTRHPGQFPSVSPEYLHALPIVLFVWFASYKYFGLYNAKSVKQGEVIQLTKANSAGILVLLSLTFFYRDFAYSRIVLSTFAASSFLLGLFSRHAFRLFAENVLKSFKWKHQVLVVGCGEVGKTLIREFLANSTEFKVVGFLDDAPALQHTFYLGVPCLGRIENLGDLLERNDIDEVMIAFPSAPKDRYKEVMKICTEREVKFKFVPKLFKVMLQDISLDIVGDVPLIGIKGNNLTGFNYIIKRAFDVVVSALMLIAAAPVMILTAFLVKMASPSGSIFFTQERFGYKREPFQFIKFRSMHPDSDDAIHQKYVKEWIANNKDSALKDGDTTVHKLTHDPRIIPFVGSFIRKTSIDELPQLFNVLKGEMSLVGPRPCLRYEMESYKTWHKARFDALPGITGLWQVSGRNRLTFDEMVRLDINYLQKWTFSMDLLILLKTPYIVIFDKAY
ncbi:exopolysaccharide biosynthesis polyprenyl glycosylphosphotransferase [delta proteobacterium NaphS2]|nr:exopolysaccharide biosynthesis polyprenyl glycosylphosphotransferase [delta proteobacterium NaphS2]